MKIIKDTEKRTKDRQIISLVECHCGKIFETERRNIVNNRTRSCGCSRIKNLIGKKFSKITVIDNTGKSGRYGVIWLCQCACSKILELSTARLTHPSRWSCGCDKTRVVKACKLKGGKNHHWYKPELSEDDRMRYGRSSIEQYSFRKLVYIRDNYTCVNCMDRGGHLNAHHLDGYHWCKEKRDLIENGVTLCQYCHELFHKIYGKNNNTRFQFLEFKKEYAYTI